MRKKQETVNDLKAGLHKKPNHRPLYIIAGEIMENWQRPYFGATPYLRAMYQLNSIDDMYGLDTADSIVRYFLSNAQTWRGEEARRIKAELKAMLKY